MAIPEVNKEQPLNLASLTWGDLTWVNIEHPAEQEMAYLAQHYPFHPLDLDDCLSRKQRPKIDQYKDYLFIVFHFPVYNKVTRVSTHGQLAVFVGDKYLITVHEAQLRTLMKLFRDCEVDEEVRQENFSSGSGYLLYRIIDGAVDSYFPVLDKILSLMEEVEDSVFDENVEAAHELAVLRRDIITQRRIIFPMRTLIANLEDKLRRFTKVDISVFFGDLVDHMNKICETLDESKEIIEVYKDTDYLLGTNRINRILRVLTILATIGTVLTAVASFYGMNVPLPGGGAPGSPHAWIILLAAMVAAMAGMILFFHRKRWI
ncbi:MAG: magnesium transporter CorA family protein [Chloroflexi bacterium]|nr:magnesium transporter CorA family protein [Chloroflexota bacterium]